MLFNRWSHSAKMLPVCVLFLVFLGAQAAHAAFAGRSDGAAKVGPSSPSARPSLLANKKVCIAGGGPCGIYLATLLIQQDPTVTIEVLERSARDGNTVNAFGIGLSSRLLHSLGEASPDLRKKVESVGAPIISGTRIVSRADLSETMTQYLEKVDTAGQCSINFGEECAEVDLDGRKVTTTSGRTINYDVLIGADGINSIVRQTLVAERGIHEDHYLEPSKWKALRLPPQSDIDATSFLPLRHKLLRGGRILPRYPEGHVMLIFWDKEAGEKNPGDVTTPHKLKELLCGACQDGAPKERFNIRSRWAGKQKEKLKKRRNIVFNEEAVELFLKARPSRSHYMKIDRFHDGSVALVGDAAAGMNSFLGQGCASGLMSAKALSDSFVDGNAMDVSSALACYSKRAVPEAHAITDLNLIAAIYRAGLFTKALVVPLALKSKIRGKPLFKRLSEVDVPYTQLLRENRLKVALGKRSFKRDREPFVHSK
jgi:kynurenine 3-monooxygenase